MEVDDNSNNVNNAATEELKPQQEEVLFSEKEENKSDVSKAPVNVGEWHQENLDKFKPPICNLLMHKDILQLMFVKGPNEREDFHIAEGSEFFFQMEGDMCLVILEQGERKDVHIRAGEVYCLPSRIPHSPQRPQADSLGLVIERKRVDGELDGMRWYTDFKDPKTVLFEKYFFCDDLGKDLVPIVKAWKESDEIKTRIPGSNIEGHPPTIIDTTKVIPDPINLKQWVTNRKTIFESSSGAELSLFGQNHPDGEFKITVSSKGEKERKAQMETYIYQITGNCTVIRDGVGHRLKPDSGILIEEGQSYKTIVDDCLGTRMIAKNDPKGNKSTGLGMPDMCQCSIS